MPANPAGSARACETRVSPTQSSWDPPPLEFIHPKSAPMSMSPSVLESMTWLTHFVRPGLPPFVQMLCLAGLLGKRVFPISLRLATRRRRNALPRAGRSVAAATRSPSGTFSTNW